jgi:hypothetical protein
MGIIALAVNEMISGFASPVLPRVTTDPTFGDIMNT